MRKDTVPVSDSFVIQGSVAVEETKVVCRIRGIFNDFPCFEVYKCWGVGKRAPMHTPNSTCTQLHMHATFQSNIFTS